MMRTIRVSCAASEALCEDLQPSTHTLCRGFRFVQEAGSDIRGSEPVCSRGSASYPYDLRLSFWKPAENAGSDVGRRLPCECCRVDLDSRQSGTIFQASHVRSYLVVNYGQHGTGARVGVAVLPARCAVFCLNDRAHSSSCFPSLAGCHVGRRTRGVRTSIILGLGLLPASSASGSQ